MKLIKTVDAEGAVLCHDITQIIRGVTKDAVFRKEVTLLQRRYSGAVKRWKGYPLCLGEGRGHDA